MSNEAKAVAYLKSIKVLGKDENPEGAELNKVVTDYVLANGGEVVDLGVHIIELAEKCDTPVEEVKKPEVKKPEVKDPVKKPEVTKPEVKDPVKKDDDDADEPDE